MVASTSAPAASNWPTTSALPARAAVISGVSPKGNALFGSAPAASRVSTMVELPFSQAAQSGVTPRSFAASTSAPARISRAAISGLSR